MKTKYILLSVVVAILLSIVSCVGYSYKSTISRKPNPKMIANNWMMEKITEKGKNVTENYEIYEMLLNKFGNAQLRLKDKISDFVTKGTWKFSNDNKKMTFKFEKSDANAVFRILKVGRNALWLKREGAPLELHFVSKPIQEDRSKSSTGY